MTDLEEVLDYIDGRLSDERAAEFRARLNAETELAATFKRVRGIVADLAGEPTGGLRLETRERVLDAFRRRSRLRETLPLGFLVDFDSRREELLAGLRGAQLADRVVRFVSATASVELVWTPAPYREAGSLRGLVDAGDRHLRALRVDANIDDEERRQAMVDADGFFVIRQIPQGRRLTVTLHWENGSSVDLPPIDFDHADED